MPQKQGSSPKLRRHGKHKYSKSNGKQRSHVKKGQQLPQAADMCFHKPSDNTVGSKKRAVERRVEVTTGATPASKHPEALVSTVRKPYKQRFAENFGNCVARSASQYRWSTTTRRLALAYVKSLLSGDGSVPEGLEYGPVQRINWHFAMTCAQMDAAPGRFPGQGQDWFEAKLAEANKLREHRRLQRASQPA